MKPRAWRAQQLTVNLAGADMVLTPQQCRHKGQSFLLLSLPDSRGGGDANSSSSAFPLCAAHMFRNTFSFHEVKAKYQPSLQRLLI